MVGRQGVHGPRHHEVGRPDQRVRRQPRHHGHLRRAAGVRPRPDVRSHRSALQHGLADRQTDRRRSADAARRRASRSQPPSARGQQFEAMLRGLLDHREHLERVRAVHRHVHHLQLVRDRRDPAAIGDRHPARARRDARGRSGICSSSRAPRPASSGRSAGIVLGMLHGARDGRVDFATCSRASMASPSARRRCPPIPRLLGAAIAIGIATSMIAALASRAERGARRSGSGAAERASIRCCRPARTARAALTRGRR